MYEGVSGLGVPLEVALECRLGFEGGSLRGWGPGSPVGGLSTHNVLFMWKVVWATYLCRLVPVASPVRVWLLDVPAVALHVRGARRVEGGPAVALNARRGGPDLCASSLVLLVPPVPRLCAGLLCCAVVVLSLCVGGVDHPTRSVVPEDASG